MEVGRSGSAAGEEIAGVGNVDAHLAHQCIEVREAGLVTQLVEELNAGRLKVVDLTQPLGPNTPVIGLPANASSLGAYESSTCALLAGGTVSCWGVDSYGTLGDGRVIRQLQPSLVVTNDALFGFAFEYY